ncbi:hypothetical protein FEF34_05325 [Streptomyces marianii]|uniref:Uncharacterized protein n=1 Tax=Streptomyces marianii TaxID=1817406 RepID=A0A5R9DYC5_9ACTN|nr:hypothetical protein FEF34_05325 [Streptomyces marianii]
MADFRTPAGEHVISPVMDGRAPQSRDRGPRRVVAVAQASWRAGNRRVLRPWTPEPGLWL